MVEDERTVESADEGVEKDDGHATDDGDSGAAAEPRAVDDEGDTFASSDTTPDATAESFFELDDDLDTISGPAETGRGGRRRGVVAGADRVDSASVPDGYRLDAETDRVLALTVDFGVETTTVYLAWPGDADDEVPLTWLLDAMGIELRDLYGRDVLVERVDGHDVLVTPDERPRGSDETAGILGGLGVVTAFVGLLATTGGVGPVLSLLWAGVTLALLPYLTYTDAWYLRTHSDWTGGPLFWAVLSALPFLNLFVGAVYLWRRRDASFFGTERSRIASVVAKVRSWL